MTQTFSTSILFVIALLAILTVEASADDAPQISRVEITVTPMASPTPVLKYELLPPLRDRVPGNRAPYYLRALIIWEGAISDDVQNQFVEVLNANDGPMSDFNADAVRELLPHFKPVLTQLEKAALREECDWNLDVQHLEGWDAISFSLEEFQRIREFARLFLLKGRLEVIEGRFDDAIFTLQMGYQLAHDVAEPPTLINSLIGIAYTSIMGSVVEAWIDQPDAPNLYWALATRPRPFLSLRDEFQFERELPARLFPVLRDPESTERSPAEWQRLVRELVVDLEHFDDYWQRGEAIRSKEAFAEADRAIADVLPIARRELLAAGFEAERLDTMPDGQLLAIHTARFVRERFDEFIALLLLPPSQGTMLLDDYEAEMNRTRASTDADTRRESLPVADKLVPALRPSIMALVRMQQRFDSYQTLEAIRAYAADHDGELPASLAAIVKIPCPVNVQTGQLFSYELQDGTAILTVPPVIKDQPQTGREYTIRIE